MSKGDKIFTHSLAFALGIVFMFVLELTVATPQIRQHADELLLENRRLENELATYRRAIWRVDQDIARGAEWEEVGSATIPGGFTLEPGESKTFDISIGK